MASPTPVPTHVYSLEIEPANDYFICTPISIECECQTRYQFYDFEEKLLLG